ncbi:MAG: UDP-N-acetylmuramate dehydrogenase [Deferribacteraceae bacterium]|jgi:UDP-N-acetylmuramate dehydrogenase|nr:UDP-N-acetylmuramate dehydrogenase [Deferribacteraceae bacterium]
MKILEGEPLAKYCSYRIGGKAAYLALPKDTEELVALLTWAKARGLDFEVIGFGANILFSDSGYPGLIISLRDFEMFCVRKDDSVIAGAGVALSELVNFACGEGLSGAENLAGIPGSVGGALRMNAGAFGVEIKDILIRANTLSYKSVKEKVLSVDELVLSYRSSKGLNGRAVLAAEFAFKQGDKSELVLKQEEIKRLRAERHPLEHLSCGSVFKRTELAPAGKLIEECGLKGERAGGAEISQKHANFIINRGNAKAKDVRELIRLARSEVLKRFGVVLEEEVRYLGEF